MDMVLNKSLSFFSTSCLHITSFYCSVCLFANAFSVPVTGLSTGMAEGRSLGYSLKYLECIDLIS